MNGQTLDLRDLADVERRFLDTCVEAYRQEMPWREFMRLRIDENPLTRATGGVITPRAYYHPLFQAVKDLEDRLGVKQGFLRADPGDNPDRPIFCDEWIPAPEAAARKGVSLAGLHKAIDRGEVIARPRKPGGVRLEVNVASLDAWQVDEARQAAGRAR